MALIKEVQVLEGHQGRVWCCAWNPSGSLLATCGEDANIRLWGAEVGTPSSSPSSSSEAAVSALPGVKWVCKAVLAEAHTRTVRRVAWSPCGSHLASASFDGTISIWDRPDQPGASFECVATLEGHESEVKAVAWSPSGNYLASCGRDKSVWVWESSDPDQMQDYTCAAVIQAHNQDVKSVLWHPDQDILASCSYDNRVKIYALEDPQDDDDWACRATLTSHDSTVWSMAFDSTGDRLATCSEDRTVKIWSRRPEKVIKAEAVTAKAVTVEAGKAEDSKAEAGKASWRLVCTIAGHHLRAVYDVDWCHLTGLIATASGDNAIRIFRAVPGSGTGQGEDDPDLHQPFSLVAEAHGAHSQDVNGVAWNPKVKGLLCSVSDDGTAKLWEVNGLLNDPDLDCT